MPSAPENARERARRAVAGALAARCIVAAVGSALAAHAAAQGAPAVAAAAVSAPAPAGARFPMNEAAVSAAANAARRELGRGETHRERLWRFKSDGRNEARSPDPWFYDLARWLAEGGRVLIWLLGAAALAFVVVMARRWMQVRGDPTSAGARLPSHVRELDIRPESLPADIGAAVRGLWLAGEHRAALSLLYRGALSRLVHSHGVAIGDSSTEGDCVGLARAALPAPQGAYVQQLVQAWLLAIYGARPLDDALVMQLCDDFDRMLPATSPRPPLQPTRHAATAS